MDYLDIGKKSFGFLKLGYGCTPIWEMMFLGRGSNQVEAMREAIWKNEASWPWLCSPTLV